MAQWVKNLTAAWVAVEVLFNPQQWVKGSSVAASCHRSQLQLRFSSCPWNLHMPWAWPFKKKLKLKINKSRGNFYCWRQAVTTECSIRGVPAMVQQDRQCLGSSGMQILSPPGSVGKEGSSVAATVAIA